MQKHVSVGNVVFGNDLPFVLIAGPCQMESREHGLEMAQALKEVTDRLGIAFVFKASFDKANRTSLNSVRGMGLDKGLAAFADIKSQEKLFEFPLRHSLNRRCILRRSHSGHFFELSGKIMDGGIPKVFCNLGKI